MFPRLRIRHKLAVSFVVAALLPVLAAYWVGVSVVLRGLERGVRADTERQLHTGLNLFLRDIEGLAHDAARLGASSALLAAMDNGPIELSNVLADETSFLSSSLIQVTDERGEVQAQEVVGGNLARFRGLGVSAGNVAVRAGRAYEHRITIESVGLNLVVRATAPIVGKTFSVRGVVVISVPLDSLFADSLKASLGADVVLYNGKNPQGGPVMASFLDPIGARAADVRTSDRAAKIVAAGDSAFESLQVFGREYTIGYAPISSVDGTVMGGIGVAVDRESLVSARRAAARSLGLGAAGALVFAIGLAGLLSRRISRPLQDLHEGALAIARGDLEHSFSVAKGDEIGDLAQAFSDMTAALKENQRGLAARMREIMALHDAGRAVSSVIDLDQVLRKVVDSVARVLHVRACALWLVDSDGGSVTLRLGAARAKQEDMRTVSEHDEVEELVGSLVAIAAPVAESRTSIRIDSMADDKRFKEAAAKAHIDGSLIASVLERKGVVVGVIIVGRGALARPFSEADAKLLSTFADQAASAIENASLYAEVRKFNEELEAKVRRRTTELQTMNDELARAIRELTDTQAQLVLSERLAGLGQLVAGVAHEINSPSAAIRGTADTLSEAIRRVMTNQIELVERLGSDVARKLIETFSEVAPTLAAKRRIAPASLRRLARAMSKELVAQGVALETAEAVARPLTELDLGSETLVMLRPFLLGNADSACFLVRYLADHVSIHRSTHTIQDAIWRIQRIVGALKEYSHLDQDAAQVKADIHKGIENTLVILEPQIGHQIEVQKDFREVPLVPMFVDQLNQVWTNLIHNAVQAVGTTGIIRIETESVDSGVQVRITDSGPGIPADVRKRMFEPFFTTKAPGEGTGLGLGIVLQIVDKHNGRVTCTSEPGRTCFDVWLPVDGGDSVE